MEIKVKEIKNKYRVTLHKVNESVIAELPFDTLVSVTKKIDDYSQIELQVKKWYYEQISRTKKLYPFYNEFKNERLIGLDGELYVIKQISEDEKNEVKTITAYSLEKKLEKINIDIKTRLGFYLVGANEEDEKKSIYDLNKYMYDETGWRFGHIDKEILYRKTADISNLTDYEYGVSTNVSHENLSYRNYESIDKTWYDFLNNELKEQYECVVVFDNKKKQVNLYHYDRFGDDFSIILSYDNYIKSVEKEYDSSDIVTRLSLEGNEEECIVQSELVTGVNYVENYSYFKEDMSTALATALDKYFKACELRSPLWKNYKATLSTKQTELKRRQDVEYRYLQEIPKLKEMVGLYTQKGMYELANEISKQLQTMCDQENVVSNEIAKLEEEIRVLKNNILVVNNLCRKENATEINTSEPIAYDSKTLLFTKELLEELKCFIFSDIYTNDAFYDANDLISAGTRILEDRCKPTKEWSLNVKDFTRHINPTQFRQNWNGTLGLGDIITLMNYAKDSYDYIYVTEWTKNFREGSLSLVLSNKKSTSDSSKIIADVLKTAMNNNRAIIRDKCITNNTRYNRI